MKENLWMKQSMMATLCNVPYEITVRLAEALPWYLKFTFTQTLPFPYNLSLDIVSWWPKSFVLAFLQICSSPEAYIIVVLWNIFWKNIFIFWKNTYVTWLKLIFSHMEHLIVYNLIHWLRYHFVILAQVTFA